MTSPESAAAAPHDGDAVDASGHVEVHQPEPALTWRVTAESNPFARQLVFDEDGDEFLLWQLAPLALNALLVALTQVRDEQLAALTTTLGAQEHVAGSPVAAATGEPVTPMEQGDGPNGRTPSQPPTLSIAWWAQHKLLAFLIALTILLFTVGFINGPG